MAHLAGQRLRNNSRLFNMMRYDCLGGSNTVSSTNVRLVYFALKNLQNELVNGGRGSLNNKNCFITDLLVGERFCLGKKTRIKWWWIREVNHAVIVLALSLEITNKNSPVDISAVSFLWPALAENSNLQQMHDIIKCGACVEFYPRGKVKLHTSHKWPTRPKPVSVA